ncbi:hypothetical protein PGTUg99_033973 [Puccinia graminis f. sp. tritici]|uniref:Uncharacterized protein n=1 Tax=Puccinia graminis f. sp. tritici TaxID=56615 RepID=A0A5B0P2W4_PUCGR|nr:hypothetical protein PGTUg99_033973 [Puccinia graminis f. sp. tritici]
MRISGCFFRPSEHPHPHPHPLAGIRAGILGYPPSKGPAGRASFQPARYLYLVDRRASFQPAISPSSRGYPLGYPDTRQLFAEKGPSTPVGGYLLALAGIRDGYPSTISTFDSEKSMRVLSKKQPDTPSNPFQ